MLFKLSKRAIIIQGTRNAVLLNEFFSQHILVSFLPNIRNTGDTIIQGHKVSIFGSWSETISPAKFNHKYSKHNALPVDVYKKINTLVK